MTALTEDIPQFVIVREPEGALVDELFKEWAHNNARGKKGFQPTTSTDSVPLSRDEAIELSYALKTKISAKEAGEVAGYLEDSGWLNDNLRAGREPVPGSWTERRLQTLDAVIERSALPHDVTTYRGVDEQTYARIRDHVGGTFVDEGYVSTSLDYKMASGFGSTQAGGTLEIRLKSGQKAFSTDGSMASHKKYDWLPQEMELLLPRGSRFRVGQEGDRIVLTMEESA